MKTSLSETIQIENYLQGNLSPENALVFEARLQIEPELKKTVHLQTLVRRFVTLYHRRRLKSEVEAIHARLFRDDRRRDFRARIMNLFNP